MKVSELIEKLKTYPPNSQIVIMTEDCYYENINIFQDTLKLYAILDITNNCFDCNKRDNLDNL